MKRKIGDEKLGTKLGNLVKFPPNCIAELAQGRHEQHSSAVTRVAITARIN